MIPAHLLPEVRTGCHVYFIGRDIVPSGIRAGSYLGAKWRGVQHIVRPVAHHVEMAEVDLRDGLLLWGADAFAGFVPKPAHRRLAGLELNRDYRVLILDDLTDERQALAQARLLELWGLPYESWIRVMRVARRGNRTKTARNYCSEAVLDATQVMLYGWAAGRDDENESPLTLEAVASRHGHYLDG